MRKIENKKTTIAAEHVSAHAVKEVTTNEWENEVTNSKIPVFVDFWAPWCGPCRTVGPIVDQIAGEYSGRVKFVKVNVDENNELASKYNVYSIPTLAVFKNSEVIAKQVGVNSNAKASLKNMIEDAIRKS